MVNVVTFGASPDLDASNPLWLYPIGIAVFVTGHEILSRTILLIRYINRRRPTASEPWRRFPDDKTQIDKLHLGHDIFRSAADVSVSEDTAQRLRDRFEEVTLVLDSRAPTRPTCRCWRARSVRPRCRANDSIGSSSRTACGWRGPTTASGSAASTRRARHPGGLERRGRNEDLVEQFPDSGLPPPARAAGPDGAGESPGS